MDRDVVGSFLEAVEQARMPDCEAFAPDAVIDATVPNWRYRVEGTQAIRSELGRWYAHAGTFEDLNRTVVPGGELVQFTLCWEEKGIPHAAHQAHVIKMNAEGITSDTIWCGGRWPASLMAQMDEAARG
jgi:hypothetical protein